MAWKKRLAAIAAAIACFVLVPETCRPEAGAESGPEIAILQSKVLPPYQMAAEGFQEVCGGVDRVLTMDGNLEKGRSMIARLTANPPDLLHVIGTPAAQAASRGRVTFPVVFSMILYPRVLAEVRGPVAGCIALPDPEECIGALKRIVPQIERIGVVHDPEQTGFLVEEGRRAAEEFGVELLSVEASSVGETLRALDTLAGKVSAFWMLPDMTITTRQVVEYMLLMSFRNRIPLLAISDKFVEMGALMALKVDYKQIGRQSGTLAKEMLEGRRSDPAFVYARGNKLVLNVKTAAKLGIEIPFSVRESALLVP